MQPVTVDLSGCVGFIRESRRTVRPCRLLLALFVRGVAGHLQAASLAIVVATRHAGAFARNQLYFSTFSGNFFMEVRDAMAEAQKCARCGCDQLVEPFGRMRHVFVDSEFKPICLKCARELTPDAVARAEEMDAKYSSNNDRNR
jgi:hypothetical protein